jgi:CxxC-x17-CxxC domain-containing protein
MSNFGRDDRSSGGFHGGFSHGGSRGFDRNRRSSFGGGRGFGGGGDRPMYKAICSNCGKECEVPFKPTNGKPVYCSDCFEKMGNGGRSEAPRTDRSDFRPAAPAFDQNKAQFEAINAKLDRVLNLLAPKDTAVVVSAPVVKEIKEVKEEKAVKSPKVKKVVKKVASAQKK